MNYDWDLAVQASNVERFGSAIATVERHRDGYNDGDPWLAMGTLADGRWFMLSAGCDYTGWDCQCWGHSDVANTREELIRMCMAEDERAALLGDGATAGPWEGFEAAS